jgi:hypothetical protein
MKPKMFEELLERGRDGSAILGKNHLTHLSLHCFPVVPGCRQLVLRPVHISCEQHAAGGTRSAESTRTGLDGILERHGAL